MKSKYAFTPESALQNTHFMNTPWRWDVSGALSLYFKSPERMNGFRGRAGVAIHGKRVDLESARIEHVESSEHFRVFIGANRSALPVVREHLLWISDEDGAIIWADVDELEKSFSKESE